MILIKHLRPTAAATFCLLSALFCFLTCGPALSAESERPNVIVILADDLGYGDLSCYGAEDLQSPQIDALAQRGMRMTNFYANCTVCSPTRAALMTGRYQELVGVPGVIRTHAENNWGYLDPAAVTLPQVLQPLGYRTALVGKWHLGLEPPNTPNNRGFEYFHGWLGDMMDDYYTHLRHDINYMRLNDQVIEPEGHATDLFTDWACQFLRAQSDEQPFFLYLAYNAPHTPIQPPEDWVERVKQREPEMTDHRAKLVALIEHMDDGIGRVMDVLEETGLDDNTLVVFSSDNGGQLNVGANNGPHRGGKQDVYEGGHQVPLIAVWPGEIEAGTESDFRAMTMDLFPTVCEAAGADIAHSIEGRSILPTWRGEDQPELRKYWHFTRREGGMRYEGKTTDAVIRGHFKLLQNSPFEPLELYDLEADPLEEQNLIDSAKHRGIRQELSAALRRQIQRGGAVPWQNPAAATPSEQQDSVGGESR